MDVMSFLYFIALYLCDKLFPAPKQILTILKIRLKMDSFFYNTLRRTVVKILYCAISSRNRPKECMLKHARFYDEF